MAGLPPRLESPAEDENDYSELFDAGQIDRGIIGVNKGVDGYKQLLEEVKEAVGFTPTGTAEFETSQMLKEQEVLRGAAADSEDLTGAAVTEFVGEALPLLTVPLGGTVLRASGLGAATGAGFFQPDVKESRLDDIATGAVLGGLFKKLLTGGRAKADVEDTINQLQITHQPSSGQLIPAQGRRGGTFGQNAPHNIPNTVNQLSGPQPQRLLGGTVGRQADDSQRLLSGPPQRSLTGATVRQGKLPAPPQKLLSEVSGAKAAVDDIARGGTNGIKFAIRARRKAEVFAARATQKSKALSKKAAVLESKLAGKESRALVALQAKTVEAEQNKVAADIIVKTFKSVEKKSKGAATLRDNARKQASDQIGVEDFSKKTKANIEAEIINTNPHAIGLNGLKKQELIDRLKIERQGKANKKGGLGKGQSGFINTDAQALASGAVAGGAIGAVGFDGDPLAIAAGAIGGAVGLRAFARGRDKVVTNKMREGMRKASAEGGEYTEKLSRLAKTRETSGQAINDMITDGKKVLDSFMGATMTRLEALSPRIATALAHAEFQQHYKSGQWLGSGDKLFKRISESGMTDIEARGYKIALLNSTKNAKKYLKGIGKDDAANAVGEFEDMLDGVGVYLGEVGLGNNLRKNYFPRMITDFTQFEGIKEVDTYLAQLAKKKGLDLTDFEKENAMTEIINGALVGAKDDTVFGRAASQLQRRTTKVVGDNVDAYADPHQGFNDYIESITTQVERRRFFKGQNVKTDDLGPNAESIDNIATRLKDQWKKQDMTPDQIDEAAQLIRMRFGPGEQAPHRAVQNFKNLTYTGLLGNPISAMTQAGDLALSAYKNGLGNTVSSMIEGLGSRGKLNGLDKTELLGIRNAASDFASKVGTRDMLNWSLKYSGFQKMDEFGKNTFINAAMKNNQQLSPNAFKAKWKGVFDPDAAPGGPTPRTDELMKKVGTFNKIDDTNREDVGFMLWNELSSTQPIALSALPEQYLKNPNGRMAYMLQSFTLKMFDVMRKDIYNNVAKGQYKQAAKNATNLTTLFVATNGSVDAAKDFVLGRESTLPDIVLNNTAKMFGASKYMFESVGREGLGSTILKTLAPPTALLDAAGDPRKALQIAPIGGRLLESRLPE